MAYKPKYAQNKAGVPQPVLREPEQRDGKTGKMGKGMLIFFILLGIVIVPLSSYLTVYFLGEIWQNVGRPKQASHAEVADMQILEFFDGAVSERWLLWMREGPKRQDERPRGRSSYVMSLVL